MSSTPAEALAHLHVIVAVAKADGKLRSEERAAIEELLRELRLDADLSARDLFDDDFDLDEQLSLLSSDEARAFAYEAAYALAWADGERSSEESALLEALRDKLAQSSERDAELERRFARERKGVVAVLSEQLERVRESLSRT